MSQTHVCFYMHVVFSTKNRVDMITVDVEDRLFGYIGGILQRNDSKLLVGNGTANHVHLLTSLHKTISLPKLIGDIKRDSSKWIKTIDSRFSAFGWQDGYAAFSVGHTQIESVKRYVVSQKAHHQIKEFEDEVRGFYRECDIAFDEKYVWD